MALRAEGAVVNSQEHILTIITTMKELRTAGTWSSQVGSLNRSNPAPAHTGTRILEDGPRRVGG